MRPGLHRLYAPQLAAVQTNGSGVPLALDGADVVAIREEWVVDDRWWIPEKLQRHYFELALADRSAVVFRCALRGRWYRQRA